MEGAGGASHRPSRWPARSRWVAATAPERQSSSLFRNVGDVAHASLVVAQGLAQCSDVDAQGHLFDDDVDPHTSTGRVARRPCRNARSAQSGCRARDCPAGRAGRPCSNSRSEISSLYGPNSATPPWRMSPRTRHRTNHTHRILKNRRRGNGVCPPDCRIAAGLVSATGLIACKIKRLPYHRIADGDSVWRGLGVFSNIPPCFAASGHC